MSSARIVLKENNLSHDQPLRQLGSTMHNVTFVFKCVHNNAPDLFRDYFIKSSHNHYTRRNGIDLLIPKLRTKSPKKGCFYSGAQAFYNLQTHLKELTSLIIFKTKLKDLFLL